VLGKSESNAEASEPDANIDVQLKARVFTDLRSLSVGLFSNSHLCLTANDKDFGACDLDECVRVQRICAEQVETLKMCEFVPADEAKVS